MKKNTHREPTLFIVGSPERADEIRHIVEDEWCGKHNDFTLDNSSRCYFVDAFGCVSCCSLDFMGFKEAVENGWMKEFKLPEKPKFKPLEKVVARSSKNSIWFADFYCRYLEYGHQLILFDTIVKYCLPFNEQTAKLIGTSDEWEGGSNEK